MKNSGFLIAAICLFSLSTTAQSTEKQQVKIEKKNVSLMKKTPVRLKKITTSSSTTTDKKEEKIVTKKPVAIEPKK